MPSAIRGLKILVQAVQMNFNRGDTVCDRETKNIRMNLGKEPNGSKNFVEG